jgi:hypothetical protein
LFRTDKDKERIRKKYFEPWKKQRLSILKLWNGLGNRKNTMDSAEQANGEKRVKQYLIEPLQLRGLAKPTTLTKAQFEDMVKDLCARLAYMTTYNLQALEEQCAGSAGGKSKDRFPIANHILDWARDVQPPQADVSPLVRAVFAAQLGLDALAGGWAPELLATIRDTRRWPKPFAVGRIREKADDSVRQMRRMDERLASGGDLPAVEVQWRNRRLSAMRRCQDIADLGASQANEV